MLFIIFMFLSLRGPTFKSSKVSFVAYTGISKRLEIMPAPAVWSLCSWVIKRASISFGEIPIFSSAVVSFFPESPQSIKIVVSLFFKIAAFAEEGK